MFEGFNQEKKKDTTCVLEKWKAQLSLFFFFFGFQISQMNLSPEHLETCYH